jgi:hypothetical protein
MCEKTTGYPYTKQNENKKVKNLSPTSQEKAANYFFQ